MYDKHLVRAESDLTMKHFPKIISPKILDAGCGEGEGTETYASVRGATVHGVDFSARRLDLARARLSEKSNVTLFRQDLTEAVGLVPDYDIVISQRFLINIPEWELQMKVLRQLMGLLAHHGRLLLLEGHQEGAAALNEFRAAAGLEPIPVKWHNVFLSDTRLKRFMKAEGYRLTAEDSLGAYFLMTRGIRPMLDSNLDWDCDFNRIASSPEMMRMLTGCDRYSRLKLWVYEK